MGPRTGRRLLGPRDDTCERQASSSVVFRGHPECEHISVRRIVTIGQIPLARPGEDRYIEIVYRADVVSSIAVAATVFRNRA